MACKYRCDKLYRAYAIIFAINERTQWWNDVSFIPGRIKSATCWMHVRIGARILKLPITRARCIFIVLWPHVILGTFTNEWRHNTKFIIISLRETHSSLPLSISLFYSKDFQPPPHNVLIYLTIYQLNEIIPILVSRNNEITISVTFSFRRDCLAVTPESPDTTVVQRRDIQRHLTSTQRPRTVHEALFRNKQTWRITLFQRKKNVRGWQFKCSDGTNIADFPALQTPPLNTENSLYYHYHLG